VQAVVELDHQLRHAREHLAELQRLRRAAAPAEHQPELEPST
jgi:hypothetical protein